MILIIGLGNPEEKYKNTRHNIGFRIVDEFAKTNSFPKFNLSKKFNSLISENVFNNKKIILAKPQTFMNESGKAVRALTNFYKIKTSDLVIIHDDMDLLLGKIKIIKSRGTAGHKGVESVVKEIGAKDFIRFRIGTQTQKGKPRRPVKFVLQKFNKEEEKIIKKVIKKTAEAIETFLEKGLEKTMNEYNCPEKKA